MYSDTIGQVSNSQKLAIQLRLMRGNSCVVHLYYYIFVSTSIA